LWTAQDGERKKLAILRKYKEDRLTARVIIPLLEKMNFENITLTHGGNEQGLDLVCNKENDFGEREYTGVQVKAVKIHGIAGKKGNATEILTQAQQAFSRRFLDIYDNREKYIDRFIVITSGNITGSARDSIKDQLIELGKRKTIGFFDGSKLVDLLDKHMPGFFFEEWESFNTYFKAMKKDFEAIKDVTAIGQKEEIPLENIYVSLKVSEAKEERDFPFDPEMEKELKIFDEKEMIRQERITTKRGRVLDADSAVKNFHRLVVVGAPGAGKTTLLKHLALKACKQNIDRQERITVPIPITLRNFAQQDEKSLKDYIHVVFEKYEFPKAKEFIEKDLGGGKCLLLLDGFDELATRENQERVAKEIQDFSRNFANCRIVVTSRTAGYHDDLSGFTKLELMEFDDIQVKQFIDNWFGETDRGKAQTMLKAVKDNESISKLAKNPLMIAIIAIIYEEDRELPQRRVELYKRTMEVLLSRWDKRKKLRNKFSLEQKEFILAKLAYENHCLNRRTVPEERVLGLIRQYAQQVKLKEEDAPLFLEEIWQRSYILRQIARDTYDFLHLCFQEYFTALELNKQEDDISATIEHINQSWWEEPILLYAGLRNNAARLIKRIQKKPEDIFYSNLMLAGKCIADAQFIEPALEDGLVDILWDLYRVGEFYLLRKRAITVLSQIKPAKLIDSLIDQLTDKKNDACAHSAYALGEIGSPKAIPALLQAMEHNKNSDVRWRAAFALGNIGNPEVIPTLLKAMQNDKDISVRWRATYALGIIGSMEVIPELLMTLENDKDGAVRGGQHL
jgi:GTPase SAR1 family protein